MGEGDGAYEKLRKAPSALTGSLRRRHGAEEEMRCTDLGQPH